MTGVVPPSGFAGFQDFLRSFGDHVAHAGGRLAQTLFFNVCDLPKAPFAEG
jgi:hypothetical protein